MKQLVKNIRCLAGVEYEPKLRLQGKEMAEFNTIDDAWLLVEDGRFAEFGSLADGMPALADIDETIDAEDGMVLPSWCDSHTHIVFAGSREREFVDKINGLSYEEIARRGGGILNSADLLHNTSEDELYSQAMCLLDEVVRKGTGCIEIKSGYGLNMEASDKAHEGDIGCSDCVNLPWSACCGARNDTGRLREAYHRRDDTRGGTPASCRLR